MGTLLLSIISLVAMATVGGIQAVEYIVINEALRTPGGIRFDNEIGIDYTKQMMEDASTFIWQTFRQGEGERKNVDRVTVIVKTMDGLAFASDNKINISADFIARHRGDVRNMFAGVLYHEMTHIWQWDGSEQSPTPLWLIEGIADFVRLKARYPDPGWKKPGEGERWDEGYSVTAYFLDYCNSLKDGFVADLNGRMRSSYSEGLFMDLLGKTVEQLWNDYKAQFGS